MIFSKKANAEDVKAAKAAGIAQGQAAAEDKFRQWYETNKDKLAAAPPPFSSNGNSSQPQ